MREGVRGKTKGWTNMEEVMRTEMDKPKRTTRQRESSSFSRTVNPYGREDYDGRPHSKRTSRQKFNDFID